MTRKVNKSLAFMQIQMGSTTSITDFAVFQSKVSWNGLEAKLQEVVDAVKRVAKARPRQEETYVELPSTSRNVSVDYRKDGVWYADAKPLKHDTLFDYTPTAAETYYEASDGQTSAVHHAQHVNGQETMATEDAARVISRKRTADQAGMGWSFQMTIEEKEKFSWWKVFNTALDRLYYAMAA